MANDTEEAQKLQEDHLATIEKLEMQKALLQVQYAYVLQCTCTLSYTYTACIIEIISRHIHTHMLDCCLAYKILVSYYSQHFG